jgi:hypothetical protein
MIDDARVSFNADDGSTSIVRLINESIGHECHSRFSSHRCFNGRSLFDVLSANKGPTRVSIVCGRGRPLVVAVQRLVSCWPKTRPMPSTVRRYHVERMDATNNSFVRVAFDRERERERVRMRERLWQGNSLLFLFLFYLLST